MEISLSKNRNFLKFTDKTYVDGIVDTNLIGFLELDPTADPDAVLAKAKTFKWSLTETDTEYASVKRLK